MLSWPEPIVSYIQDLGGGKRGFRRSTPSSLLRSCLRVISSRIRIGNDDAQLVPVVWSGREWPVFDDDRWQNCPRKRRDPFRFDLGLKPTIKCPSGIVGCELQSGLARCGKARPYTANTSVTDSTCLERNMG